MQRRKGTNTLAGDCFAALDSFGRRGHEVRFSEERRVRREMVNLNFQDTFRTTALERGTRRQKLLSHESFSERKVDSWVYYFLMTEPIKDSKLERVTATIDVACIIGR